jgi:hypothetical protein
MKKLRKVDSLTVRDFRAHPVWEYALDVECEEGNDETSVRPVLKLPVSTLGNRVVGTKVRLANGTKVWAVLGNVDVRRARSTAQFLHVSIWRGGKEFFLARYFDSEYAKQGPEALARFLGMGIDDVFPISYDLRAYVKGTGAAIAGAIPREPPQRLSDDERIELAVPKPRRTRAPRRATTRKRWNSYPASRSTWAIGVLRGVLASDPHDATTGLGRDDLRCTKRVDIEFWTTKAEATEAERLARRVKALIRRRGRAPDGSTVAEINITDRRTGRVY